MGEENTQEKRDRESTCQKAVSKQHKSKGKWIKKQISAAIYSEQTSDKTWQGQGEKEQSLTVAIYSNTPRPGSTDPSDGKAARSRFPAPVSTSTSILVASFAMNYKQFQKGRVNSNK